MSEEFKGKFLRIAEAVVKDRVQDQGEKEGFAVTKSNLDECWTALQQMHEVFPFPSASAYEWIYTETASETVATVSVYLHSRWNPRTDSL